MTRDSMPDKEYTQIVAERLDGVQPQMRDEPNAYKRAIIRMAIEEHMRLDHEAMTDVFERHG